jgi:naphthoate synthase
VRGSDAPNKVVAKGKLYTATRQWCETIKGHSPQTLRATKKSLNHESDELYASWQHGMELLANICGTEGSLEGMQAFLDKRKPDFQKFRRRNEQELDRYLAGLARDENRAPAG